MLVRLQRLFTRPLQLWLLLWLGVTLLYLPAWKGGFQQDFHGWLQMYTDLSFKDCLNRKFAGINSFYQLTQLQLYVWTWLFGVHQMPWYLLFTAMHAVNGTLLFVLCSRLMRDFGVRAAEWVAFAGTLFFLCNPGMTEAVLWKACYHYHIALIIVLAMLIWAHRYMTTGDMKWVWRALILFTLSTLTLEIWYTIPWLLLLLFAAYYRGGIIGKDIFRKAMLRLFVPTLGIFITYLIIYHQVYGAWVAHAAYRSEGDDSLKVLVGRIWSYQFHLLAFGRFFPNNIRSWVYDHVSGGAVGWIVILIIIVGFGVYAFMKYPRAGGRFRMASLLTGWSVVAVVLVLHFAPEVLMRVSNDRYLYFMGAFEFMLVAVVMSALIRRRKGLWIGLTVAVLMICIAFTGVLVWQWRQSNKVFWGIQDKYKWEKAPLVLLLNLPATYEGVGIIHSHKPDDFTEHMRIFQKRPAMNNVRDVSSYNMQHPWDGAHVTVLDSMNLKVTLNQWGSWWWDGGLGAKDFENEYFAVRFTDPGHEYMLRLKQRVPGMVILFLQGAEWRAVDMNNRTSEQW